MRFVANLRSRTIEAFGRHGIQPDAYLLSTHRITPAALSHASAMRDKGIPIMADNGSKELIDQVIATFQDEARSVWHRVRDIRHEVGHTPRGTEIPERLRQDASDLAHRVTALATRFSDSINPLELLDAQLSMQPTHLFAQEDFAVACLVALNLERETTGWPVRAYETRNRRSIRLWRAVKENPRVANRVVFAVLSGVDYNTARAAGRMAAQSGVEDVAIGCAGIMLDKTAVDFFTLGTGNFRLEQAANRRYVRFVQVIAGLRDGFSDVGSQLRSFHALGLGAPTMFPLVAAATPSDTELTTDATSPIHAAVRNQSLYEYGKYRNAKPIRRIVGRLLGGDEWSLKCPFCVNFGAEDGHDPRKAREVWEREGRPMVDDEFIRDSASLAQAIPLFAGRDPERKASRTHVAHNHWALGALARNMPKGTDRRAWADERMTELRSGPSLTIERGLNAAAEILDKLAEH